MKMNQIFLIMSMIILQFLGCGGNNKQKALDMITARTMGLAYLEENNLPEAELAFQQTD